MLFALLAQLAMTTLTLHANCDRLATPGRLRCTLEATSPVAMQWADAQVIEVPPFLTPLRARLADSESDARTPELIRWQFASVASAAGEGEIVFRVRALTCISSECTPTTTVVRARVSVGR